MLAMQLTRLSAESRESAVIAERNRMARDIHDTLAQGLTGVIMQLEAVKGAIAQNNVAKRQRVFGAGFGCNRLASLRSRSYSVCVRLRER